jgi:hypothetical protein
MQYRDSDSINKVQHSCPSGTRCPNQQSAERLRLGLCSSLRPMFSARVLDTKNCCTGITFVAVERFYKTGDFLEIEDFYRQKVFLARCNKLDNLDGI